jgi:hypothetical protein
LFNFISLHVLLFFTQGKYGVVTAVKRVGKLNILRGRKSERLVSLEINDKQKVRPLLEGTSK